MFSSYIPSMYSYKAGASAAIAELGLTKRAATGPTYLERAHNRVRKWMPKSRIGKGALAGGVIGTGMAIKNLAEGSQ